jgi:hypothetical protein
MIKIKNTNYIFIHIPKCGGTSIIHALKKTNRIDGVIGSAHSKVSDYLNSNKTYVTTVRNPYNRFFSYYHFLIEWSKKRVDGKLPLKGRTIEQYKRIIKIMKEIKFEGWVYSLLNKNKINNLIKEYYIPQHAFTLQYDWIKDANKLSIHKLEEQTIWKFLNLTKLHSKKSTYKTTKGYTKEQAEIVYKYYQKDFDYFKYKKDSYERTI